MTTISHIKVDRNDADEKALTGYAGRLLKLLGQRRVQSSPHMVAALDDFLGALYALLFARQRGFVDRTNKPIEARAVVKRTKELNDGDIRSDGPWMVGFHFNSGIYRIAAAYHRVLKVVTGQPETGERVDKLRPLAEALYLKWRKSPWSRAELDGVLGQVNKLKHAHGIFYRRTVKYAQAMKSVDELLVLVEAWSESSK